MLFLWIFYIINDTFVTASNKHETIRYDMGSEPQSQTSLSKTSLASYPSQSAMEEMSVTGEDTKKDYTSNTSNSLFKINKFASKADRFQIRPKNNGHVLKIDGGWVETVFVNIEKWFAPEETAAVMQIETPPEDSQALELVLIEVKEEKNCGSNLQIKDKIRNELVLTLAGHKLGAAASERVFLRPDCKYDLVVYLQESGKEPFGSLSVQAVRVRFLPISKSQIDGKPPAYLIDLPMESKGITEFLSILNKTAVLPFRLFVVDEKTMSTADLKGHLNNLFKHDTFLQEKMKKTPGTIVFQKFSSHKNITTELNKNELMEEATEADYDELNDSAIYALELSTGMCMQVMNGSGMIVVELDPDPPKTRGTVFKPKDKCPTCLII